LFVVVHAGPASLRGEHEERAEAPLVKQNVARELGAASAETAVLASVASPSAFANPPEHNEDLDLLSGHDKVPETSLDYFIVPEYGENDDAGENGEDETNEQRSRMLLTVTKQELRNAAFIQRARTRKGLGNITFATDVQKEAKRWANLMARTRTVKSRNPLDKNINPDWRKLAEIDGSDDSIGYNGMFSQLLRANRSRAFMFDPVINRIGLGIAKNRTDYYVCYIFKAV
jgi:hypothetical protein